MKNNMKNKIKKEIRSIKTIKLKEIKARLLCS